MPPTQASSDTPQARPRRQVGRPPTLSIPQIVDAAIEIGISSLTMAKVARRLEVSITALYRHVASREELVRLASDRQAKQLLECAVPERSWLDICLQKARQTYEFLVDHPHTTGLLLDSSLGPSFWIRRKESFIMALCDQGVSMADALMLTKVVDQLAAGGATSTVQRRASAAKNVDYAALVTEAIDELARTRPEHPPFNGRRAEFERVHREYDWCDELRIILEALAVRIGLPVAGATTG